MRAGARIYSRARIIYPIFLVGARINRNICCANLFEPRVLFGQLGYVLSHGFGFGFGLSIALGLGWIMDLFFYSDLDLGLDYFFN